MVNVVVKMEDLLKQTQALDIGDQQKLLSSLIRSSSPDVQLSLLLPGITAASSYVKWRLVTLFAGQDTPDLFTLLPPELQVSILVYIDGISLLQASQVSKEWNRVIKSQNQIWFKKCKELGVNVEKMNSESEWHQVYVSSLRQQLCMKNGTAFTERFMQLQNCKKAVKAVDYQHGFLCTVSEEDYVNIWQLELNIPVLAFPVQRAVSCIKFKPKSYLVCGHFVGILTSWDLSVMTDHSCIVYDSLNDIPGENTLLKCKFKMHAGPVFSCDFSKELDLVVSGGADECIKLWCLSTGLVVKSLPNQDHWVLRVILLPDLTYESDHVIICMTRDNVNKICWPSSCDNELNNDKSATDDKENVVRVNQMGDLNKIIFQSRIQRNEGNNNFFTPGLQQSTKFVGLIKQDIDEKHANLCIYDIQTFQIVHNITLKFKVKKLLALGNRFALLLTIGNVLYSSTLVAVDIVTGETVGTHPVPHSKMTTPDGAQLVVGDTDWLDGLRGYVPEDTCMSNSSSGNELSNKNQNLACNVPFKEEVGNCNDCGVGTTLVNNDNRFDHAEGVDHNIPCCSSSVGGFQDLDTRIKEIHLDNSNFNSASYSGELPTVSRIKSNLSHAKMRLERPSHLVLAAGVQCEPGRLFTLWWSNYKIMSKYKEE
ncbi:F-box/WD repeat-containing protein 2-like isoform X2 [Palaemon carinicauda]|uniref:F-box/WD repeat-containing protein 2-like isoform X2 n=1 Tax=Palaemon carinicauda TaxID=392227 RepID=UPI0035B577CF